MRLVCTILLALFLTGCNEDGVKEQAYKEGYSAGLEDQRAHICGVVQYEEAALEVLQYKRICN